jgi:tetratricopeptide (TPR) repeat protein
MKFIFELIGSLKTGWHSGKGHKLCRSGNYHKAIWHYEKALSNENTKEGRAVLFEFIGRTFFAQGNLESALDFLEKAYSIYTTLDQNVEVFRIGTSRVGAFVDELKSS